LLTSSTVFQIISVPKSHLNEDDGVFDDADGGKRTAFTNPVSGTF